MDIFKIPSDKVNKADKKSTSFRPKEQGKGAGGKPVKAIFLLVDCWWKKPKKGRVTIQNDHQ